MNASTNSQRDRVGPHFMRVEAPDLVTIWFHGFVDEPEAQLMSSALARSRAGDTVYLLSIIETKNFDMSEKARRAFLEHTQGIRTVVDAIVRPTFRVRVIGRLMESATRLLFTRTLLLGFHDDEASAREWLRAQGCRACGNLGEPQPG